VRALHVMMPHVIATSVDSTIFDAIELMLKYHISGLPIVDKSQNLVGIISEGDFLRRVEIGTEKTRNRWLQFLLGPDTLANEYIKSHGRKISEIMTHDPVTATEYTPLEEVARLMERHHIKRIPITRGKKLVGIITRANLIQAVAAKGKTIRAVKESDHAIRMKVLDEIAKQAWASAPLINIAVHNGIVELFGIVYADHQEEALKILVENIPGVKGISSELTWVDPMSGTVVLPPNAAGKRKVIAH